MLRPARVRRTCVRVRVVRPTWVVRLAGVVRLTGLRSVRVWLAWVVRAARLRSTGLWLARPVLGWLQRALL